MEHSIPATAADPTVSLQTLPQAAWICDARGRIVAANEHWKRYVGPVAAMRTWWLSDRLVHPEDIAMLRSSWGHARDTGEPFRVEARLRRFDGSWRYHVLQVGMHDSDSPHRQWLATCTDIEDVPHAPRVRQPIDEQLEQLRSDIITTVGHELRTPLTSIYGMAVTLQHRDANLSLRARSQLLDIIVDQSMRMTATIDDVLAASSIEHGTLQLQHRRCDIGSIVRSVVATFDAASGTSTVRLQSPVPQVDASVDPERLRQALANLVENAVKYSPGGSEVVVRVWRRDGNAIIDVIDHGIGIPLDQQEHVFERFRRLDPSLTRGVSGTGLGLYISRELARRMGGDVTLRSQLGHGSTFTLQVPALS